MRFQISYPGGTTHEVDLPGSLCIVGRDPGCDIVLNDSKCSRRHAVVEDTAEGIVIRDSGSANGIYLNGKKVQSGPLRPGDSVRLGEVKLRLLQEIGDTVVVAPEDVDFEIGGPTELGGDTAEKPLPRASAAATPAPPAAPPPPAASPRPPTPSAARPPARARRGQEREARDPRLGSTIVAPMRPATVSLLAGLWAFFVPLAVAGVLLAAARFSVGAAGWVAAGVGAAALAGLGTAMALGLRALAPWARHLQIATAALGLLVCPFTLAAATVLLYMTRPEVKAAFEAGGRVRASPDSAEPTFALSLIGMLVLGIALVAIAVLVL